MQGWAIWGVGVRRFRGGLVFEAHRLLHLSTQGLRVIKKHKEDEGLLAVHVQPPCCLQLQLPVYSG